MLTHVCRNMHKEVRGQLVGVSSFLNHMVPELEPGLSGLVVSTFNHRVVSLLLPSLCL